MSFKMKVKDFIFDIIEYYHSFSMHKCERNKFNDSRRISIYSRIELTDKQKKEIDELYIKYYGKRIPYHWHQYYTAYTGRFDAKYIPELLYIPEFEWYENMYNGYVKSMTDKNMLPIFAKGVGVSMPKTIISCSYGVFRDCHNRIISKKEALRIINSVGEAFCKPSIDSNSGEGCFIVDFNDGIDLISNHTSDSILETLGHNFCIQTRIKCHHSIQKIYPYAVNTFRVITYRWKNEVFHFPSLMRIGRNNSFLDNAHAGGIFIGIHDDGQLEDNAFTEFNESFSEHPNTKVIFRQTKIELFPKVLLAAHKMHQAIPQLGSVNWDFTINENGDPILIEANVNSGSIWLSQIANGKGAFEERTEEVLSWLRLMKKTRPSDRKKYNFGLNSKTI